MIRFFLVFLILNCLVNGQRSDPLRLLATVPLPNVEGRIDHLAIDVQGQRVFVAARAMRPRPVLTAPNQEWAVDFASDVAASGRRLRILSVVDSYTRECLALDVDTSLPSRRVTRLPTGLRADRCAPLMGPAVGDLSRMNAQRMSVPSHFLQTQDR